MPRIKPCHYPEVAISKADWFRSPMWADRKPLMVDKGMHEDDARAAYEDYRRGYNKRTRSSFKDGQYTGRYARKAANGIKALELWVRVVD